MGPVTVLMMAWQDNHKNCRWKINCVRNRVKGSKRITLDCRSNLFTQDLCDVKCNIQMEIIQTTHSSTIYLVAIIIPIGEHRYGLQHKVSLFYKIAVFLDSSKMHQFAFGRMTRKCTRYAQQCAVVVTLSCTGNISGQIGWVSPEDGEYCHHLAACK